jgi:hypothetical protein
MVSLCLNVVIPKSAQLKESFVAAINCAVETQTNFLDKYAESVVNVTNGIASNIIGALNVVGLSGEKISTDKKATNKDEQKAEPINTSADNCIITGNNINNQSEINELKTKITGLTYTKINDETNLYFITEVVHTNGTTDTGILFFILFAILVVRIKDTIAVLYNSRNIVISRLG